MRLTSYVVAMYLNSAQGSALTAGFERLVVDELWRTKRGSRRQPRRRPPPDRADQLSPAAQTRIAIKECFGPLAAAVERTLRERELEVPNSMTKARTLYGKLLRSGVTVTGEDAAESQRRDAWFIDEVFPDAEREDSCAEGELVDSPVGGKAQDGARLWAASVAEISWALH